jgi:uncharacterized spore protein YtfJ
MTTTIEEAKDTARAAAAEPIDKVLDRLGERIGTQATVKAVFGEPVQREDLTVIPVARVRFGLGGGSGSGPMSGRQTDAETGSGSGAGGGAMSDPLGYIEVRPGGATFVPLSSPYLNPALIVATGLAAGFVIRSLARLIRG